MKKLFFVIVFIALTSKAHALTKQAWIYPGPPACNASVEYQSRSIDVLKAEYLNVNSSGKLATTTSAAYGCNGYSVANAESVKTYSKEQYITVAGQLGNYRKLIRSATLRKTFINTAVNFTKTTGFTGIDIDFEQFGEWTATDYKNYKTFISELGTALHNNGKKLQVNLPAIWDTASQSWFKLRYEDFNSLPVDELTIMAYDYQYDYGAGSPVQPITWLNGVIDWAKLKIADHNRIVMGIPAYGYSGTCGGYTISILTYDQTKLKHGFSTAVRDKSQEMKWKLKNICYFYSDSTTLDAKLKAITDKGLAKVSVWHLGGNLWFNN